MNLPVYLWKRINTILFIPVTDKLLDLLKTYMCTHTSKKIAKFKDENQQFLLAYIFNAY